MAESPARTALVGRGEELAAVLDALRVEDEPVSVHHVVGGDAGVGKTRFTSALVDEVASRGWRTMLGHCVDFESTVPYLPFSEALGRLANEELTEFEALAADVPSVGGLLPGRRLLGSSGGSSGDSVDRAELFDAIHSLLERLAAEQPTLLVIEDLHWADQSTRELLSVLFARPFANPFGVVATSRSDDLHRRHPLRKTLGEWARLPAVRRIELGPLDSESMASLVRQFDPDGSAGRLDEIVSRAEGNAFFAEELAMAAGDDRFPADLSDLLLVRLDLLTADEAQVVRTAACAGRRVSHRLLSAVLDGDPTSITAALRGAVEANVLVPAGQDAYSFRHALLAEAVYDDLLPGERVEIHARYAKALAEGLASGTAAELARHARLGGDSSTALRASVAAGDEAMAVGGPDEAVVHYELALELLAAGADPGSEVDRVSLVVRTSEALEAVAELPRALAILVTTLADSAGLLESDQGRLHLAATELLDDAGSLGDGQNSLQLALEHSEHAVRLLGGDDSPLLARASMMRARVLAAAGRTREGAELATEALRMADQLGLARMRIDARSTLLEIERRDLTVVPDALAEIARRQESFLAAIDDLAQEAARIDYLAGQLMILQLGMFDSDFLHERERADRFAARILKAAFDAGRPWTGYAQAAFGVRSQSAFEEGRWGWARDLVDSLEPTMPPAVRDWFLPIVGSHLAAGEGDFETAERLVLQSKERWPNDAGRMHSTLAPAVESLAALHGVDAAWSWYQDDIEPLRRQARGAQPVETVMRWNVFRVRITAILLMIINDHVSPEDRDAWVGRVDELTIDAEEAISQHLAVFGWWGRDGAAWVPRFQAELATFRGEEPTSWPEAIAEFDTAGNLYEAARSRVRSGIPEEVARGRKALEEMGAIPHVEAAAVDASLTGRENEILALVAEGLSNGEIGKRLFISTKTVSVHVSNILAKLGVSSRTEAAAHYLRSSADG